MTTSFFLVILLGNLKSEPSESEQTESALRDYCQIVGCKNLIKDNTCYKNLKNTLVFIL